MRLKSYTTNSNEKFVEKEEKFIEDTKEGMRIVNIYPHIRKQEILGFGGAFTEAAAYTLSKMSNEKRKEVMENYFGEHGNKYNFCRTHMQSCDFSLGNYAYVVDENDNELKTFNIGRDRMYLIPMIKDAIDINSDIQIICSPWSPPSFMKSNKEMNFGGKLLNEYKQMWADMFVKYIKEYKKLGINISRLTIQNEPASTQTWDSCIYDSNDEREFIEKYLYPTLERNDLAHIKILIWDHNKEEILNRTEEILQNERMKKCVSGVAFHWYTGDHFEAVSLTYELYPELELIFTEGCVEYSRFKEASQTENAEMYAHDIIGNLNSGMNAYIDWNLVLDQNGGPNHVENFCDAPVMCNIDNDTVDTKLSFYYIGHFSRYIKPGAVRIGSSKYTDKLEVVAFQNPDGEHVAVILNRSNNNIPYVIRENSKICKLSIEAHSISTVCWKS